MTDLESDSLLPTRRSLITRLKNWNDQEGWREFFETYWKLIYSVAIKSGLTDEEAEDVVQETVVTIAKTMPDFKYDRAKCRFKTWLMRITRMRIVDQFRKRGPEFARGRRREAASLRTPTEERIADATPPFVETLWDDEWQKNLVDAAMEKVKRRVKPQHYQIFYLSFVKELKAPNVARTLGVSAAQVYLVKHRVAAQVKRQIQKLERQMNSATG
jgi:RNA polymerase sigma factor (sigma-70 family)